MLEMRSSWIRRKEKCLHTRKKRNLQKEQVQQLFLSVNWISGKYPERLYKSSYEFLNGTYSMG